MGSHSPKCTQRIDILGEQLNDSYRFDLQKKLGLKKLTAYFSNPSLLFKEAATQLQIKIAALFLKEKSIYREHQCAGMLKFEVNVVCGHQWSSEQFQPKESGSANILTKEQNDCIEEIIKIEKDSGGYILP